MSRLRPQCRIIVWLVLVAWVIQLPVTALHSHGLESIASASTAVKAARLPSSDKSGHDADICPICWSIATTAAALTAPPLALIPPQTLAAALAPVPATASSPPSVATAFDARGPPRAA